MKMTSKMISIRGGFVTKTQRKQNILERIMKNGSKEGLVFEFVIENNQINEYGI